MKIAIGADHAGFELKEKVKKFLIDSGHEVLDLGTNSTESVNYAEYAEKVARAVSEGKTERGILICGTGIGMSIAANKIKGIRAALVHSIYTAKMASRHNNANIITFGGRIESPEEARAFIMAWLETPYEGERHDKRLNKIKELEENC
ncbi:MAG: ribose 5-phosphate isomerase B [Candidatus Aminicenantes bacterium]|nr:ribose 5-phosphate isomerase B [Candidatus Aminicenantes bacterium]